MGRAQAGISRELRCPDCAGGLEPVDSLADAAESSRFVCPVCRGVFRVERVQPEPARNKPRSSPSPGEAAAPTPVGSIKLAWRALVLWILEQVFWSVNLAGAVVLLLLGGFVPALGGWLRDEVESWTDVVELLGGVWFRTDTNDPDADLGPVLARVDAPLLFGAIDEVSRRLGVKPPGQVRLTYLPCCGVVAWRRSQALLIGLPLLRVLTQAELRDPRARAGAPRLRRRHPRRRGWPGLWRGSNSPSDGGPAASTAPSAPGPGSASTKPRG